MPFEAELVHGTPRMVDHTPSGAVAAGEVVIVGNWPHIAHLDIAANTLGALAARGAVYRVKATGAIIARGKKVYWDNTNNVITETASGNLHIGSTETAFASGGYGLLLHEPDGEPAA